MLSRSLFFISSLAAPTFIYHLFPSQTPVFVDSFLKAMISLFSMKFVSKGVLLGAICSFAYRTFDIIHYSSKHIIKTPFIKSLTKILLYVPFAALLIFVTLRLDVQVHSFSQWVLYALALGVAYGLCLGAVALLQAKREKLL